MTEDTDNMPENAIEIKGLGKQYKTKDKNISALNGIDLTIKRGQIFGLLGPNGAGKSTTINIMAGLVKKTTGNVNIWGIDLDEDERNCRAAIGIVPQELNLDPFFKPYDLLEIQAGFFGIAKKHRHTEDILRAVGLWDKRHAAARALSGGMRRRLLIAKAMVHFPPILVLDEPTAGVDLELRQHLWQMVEELNQQGITIVLTTHYLEEAEALCDHIAIISKGDVITSQPKAELLSLMDQKIVQVTGDKLPQSLSHDAIINTKISDDEHQLTITYHPSKIAAGEILNMINGQDAVIKDISTIDADLEDIFLELTAGAHADEA